MKSTRALSSGIGTIHSSPVTLVATYGKGRSYSVSGIFGSGSVGFNVPISSVLPAGHRSRQTNAMTRCDFLIETPEFPGALRRRSLQRMVRPLRVCEVRQLLSNRFERLAMLVEHHINDCVFEWREYGRAAEL